MGRNAQLCATVFQVPLVDLAGVNKKCLLLATYSVETAVWFSNLNVCTVSQTIELLYFKHGYVDFLQFSARNMDCIIECLFCT